MSNIFEGAKFGDKYITRAGNVALFFRHDECGAVLFYEDGNTHMVNYDGCYHDLACFAYPGDYLRDIDIVGRYSD